MKQDIISVRDTIIQDIWKRYKTKGIAMSDLSDMFNVSMQTIYRIIANGKKAEK